MPYPKKAKQENTNAENVAGAPVAPVTPSVAAPQVGGVRGGAPRINPVQSHNALKQAWNMTGSHSGMYDRTFQRTQLGIDAAPVAQSLRTYWDGKAADGTGANLPTPATMSLEDAQKYLGDLSDNIKALMTERMNSLPEAERNSPFWRAFQNMPAEMATLTARRIWTNRMVGTGPVADWMKWLGK